MLFPKWQERGLPRLHLLRFDSNVPDLREESLCGLSCRHKTLPGAHHRNLCVNSWFTKLCGSVNVNVPCMKVDKKTGKNYCDKYYLESFRDAATVNNTTGQLDYRRPDNGGFEMISKE